MYIPLHLHTVRSIGDSILQIDDLINKLKEKKITSCAVTNHGTISDIYEFHSKATKNNIKPILGCEFYINNNIEDKNSKTNHIIVIAKNKTGFKNLIKLHNFAQLDNFYKKPCITFNKLKELKEGLIVLTACVGGELPQLLLDKKEKEADDFIIEYKEAFKDDFYLEIQPGDFIEQEYVNTKIVELSKKHEVQIVITNDVHYLNSEDYVPHNVHVLGSRKSNDFSTLVYPDKCYYLMDEKELRNNKSLNGVKDVLDMAINNTVNISNKVDIYPVLNGSIMMPRFEDLTEEEAGDLLEERCFDKLLKISHSLDDVVEYVDRLYYELDVIKKLKFNGYFLVVADYVNYALENDVETNAGRGSICASLVAYLIDITKVDPVKYDLLFERFLSENRTSPPDIDLDFDAQKRGLVFSYIIEKYGKEHCAMVSTFATRKSKSAIKDVGRVYGHSQEVFDSVADLIPQTYYIDNEDGDSEKKTDLSIDESIELVPKLKEIYKNNSDWFNNAKKLCDLPKSTSVHAAGTLISPINLYENIPLLKNSKTGLIGTSLNLQDAESIGIIKFDVLSIATLGAVNKIKKLINVNDLYELIGDCDDEKVWSLLGTRNLAGLFQVSSNTYIQRMPRLKPTSISELANCLALLRSPCIASKADRVYMDILSGKREIELVHHIYDEVTKDTNGIILYQEQLMFLCHEIGFSMEESFNIMKAVAKKHQDKIKKYKKEFMYLCNEKSIDVNTSEKIFKIILDCGTYCFNRGHAVGYAIFCYLTAYLKTYYLKEFLAASLTNAYERKNDVTELINDANTNGIKFLDLDANKSKWDFSVEEEGIRVGFSALMGMGESSYEELNRIRPIKDMNYLLENINRSLCGKKALVPAILCGAFDFIDADRLKVYEEFYNLNKTPIEEEFYIQSTKSRMSIYEENSDIEEVFLKYSFKNSKVASLKTYNLESLRNGAIVEIETTVSRVKKITDKNGNKMAFLDCITGDGLINITVFSSLIDSIRGYKKGSEIKIKVRKNIRNNKDGYILL